MTIYEKYSFLRGKIKELEEQMSELEPQILEEIKSLSAPMKTEAGTFTTQTRAVWKYSPAVDNKKKEMVELQKMEQEKGIATKEEKLSLRFIEAK